MTNRNKLIVGAVVLVVAYYLYDRSRKMKAVADAKAGADEKPETISLPSTMMGGGKSSYTSPNKLKG